MNSEIEAVLTLARPQVLGALLRYFGDLDAAEDAFQEASLRALKNWPERGLPRDPGSWLIVTARNAAVDEVRRRSRHSELPDEIAADASTESALADHIDRSHYGDDLLRLLFICCHPELPAAQQVALALRVVSGMPVKAIARAFLVSEDAMEQRITRAKRRIASARLSFEAPGGSERRQRLRTVSAMIYLLFNEGYSASGGEAHVRAPLCEEGIRLARLLLELFPEEPEIMGLTALFLLQHARTAARLDADGAIILLEQQDRRLWNRSMIDEGLRLVENALRLKRPGTYQIQAAIAAVHARAGRADETDWVEIDRLYALLETVQPSPVVALNRVVAISKVRGIEAAVAHLEPLAGPLSRYFSYHGLKGALLGQIGRVDEAREAYQRAIELAHTPAEVSHIRMLLEQLEK